MTKWELTNKDTIILSNFFVEISQDWVLDTSETTLLAWHIIPCFVWEMRVDWASDDLTIMLGKFSSHIRKCNQFSWTDEGEIQWIEEKANPFTLSKLNSKIQWVLTHLRVVLFEWDLFESTIDNGLTAECWCWVWNLCIRSASNRSDSTTQHFSLKSNLYWVCYTLGRRHKDFKWLIIMNFDHSLKGSNVFLVLWTGEELVSRCIYREISYSYNRFNIKAHQTLKFGGFT